jgi:hypothetical protein
MNNGDGTFNYTNQPNIGVQMNSFAVGDLNSDGFSDFFATPYGYGGWMGTGNDSLYINDGNSNNYLTVTLEGTVSNIDGIGAWIEIFGPWGVQVREVRSGASYGIQNSLNAHFGLGTSTQVDSLQVKWPSGIIDVHTDVGSNQFFHVIEGENALNVASVDPLSLTMYPNPASDKVMINLKKFEDNLVVTIYDAQGKMMDQMNLTRPHEILDLDRWESGNYFLELSKEGQLIGRHQFVVID